MSDERRLGLPISLPDTSVAIPRNDRRIDLVPIRQPQPRVPLGRKPSLAARRRRRLINS
jgi:hypothetical protein